MREDRKLTLQEVYDATGVHIARIESSKSNVTLLTLMTLCRHYRVRLMEVLDGLDEFVEEG
ncbi:helix-turn-helix domain-containing protein [Hymenobacter sp. AT01-02]|uniref:helix-turn-helix domain-containing protein n=1 Tax=Hymenobacter sp. AT01-02 TaxID=1571877 RepID=UPI000AC1EE4C|nr:helix-turn-helix transcriptional regulator [Hymenobacter sp. AT01-02]